MLDNNENLFSKFSFFLHKLCTFYQIIISASYQITSTDDDLIKTKNLMQKSSFLKVISYCHLNFYLFNEIEKLRILWKKLKNMGKLNLRFLFVCLS